ncbi:uncharacterized protein LOC122616965 [Drosophila teissieri]|uniref:uncharacterized protein LOC122616965 n=1 Tax=Drosophila teissieri TaxID=7243 RepID=UPI001CBA4BE8|nr:uncharacterized protein LOC122616965 [Drosophila teissieri]
MLHSELLPPAGHQGIYAPLSQAMSDSESDEEIEIHNAANHRQKLPQKLQQAHQPSLPEQLHAQRIRIPPNTLALKLPHTRTSPTATRIVTRNPIGSTQKFQLEGSSYATNMQNTFRSVMLSDNGGVGSELSHFNSDFDANADNVAILGDHDQTSDDLSKRTPMSPARKCCFIGSLLLCFIAIVSFVWLIPCGNPDGTGSCPAVGDRIRTHNWFNNYTKAELKGGVNVVGGLRAWENNLIFMYRGDAFFPEFRPGNERRNGIICLIGSSGAVAWFVEMVDEPVALDCTLIDIDGNGKPACLVLDEYGELGALHPVSGEWLWWFKERSARKVDAYDFPIILPDLDADGVLDLLLVTSLSLVQRTKSLAQPKHESPEKIEARNVLRMLSGRKGTPIGEGFTIHECDNLSNVKLEAGNVSFTCQRGNGTEQQRSKSLAELYALITNKSIVGQRLGTSKISQHRNHGQRRELDAQRNIYSLSGRELVVENRGRCPEDCNVTFVLSEVRDGKPHVVENFIKSGMYGMKPAQWHFKNTKSQMSGFVMKFWKWHGLVKPSKQSSASSNSNNVQKSGSNNHTKNMNAIKDKEKSQAQAKKQQQQQRLRRSTDAKDHEFQPPHQEFDVFEHIKQKRETFGVPSPTKNLTKSSGISPGGSYKMNMITETVLLVVFVGADTHIENTSQSNIVQFCRHDRKEAVCQPDLNNQDHSMLVADLDQDGSQELVTYMSTFVHPEDQPLSEWKLLTYVRLLRLQAELPAYFEVHKHN